VPATPLLRLREGSYTRNFPQAVALIGLPEFWSGYLHRAFDTALSMFYEN
jgi:hypothetical protein